MGSLSQMCAGLTHHVSPSSLARISNTVPSIVILTGDDDNLVSPSNSDYLAKYIPRAHYEKWEGTGHAIYSQWPERLNNLIAQTISKGREEVEAGWQPTSLLR
jgi:pimeloyl-ACP methyl ester carboxylesterase